MIVKERSGERAKDDQLNNDKRSVRLPLSHEQFDLLISYAVRQGFIKTPPIKINDQNTAAKQAIMSRLGFDRDN